MRDLLHTVTRGLVILIGMATCACGAAPAAPTPPAPTTGLLHVGIDLSTCYLVGQIAVSVDGTLLGFASPGDAGLSKQVAIGGHSVSGIGATRDGTIQVTWASAVYQVPATGFNLTLPCTVNRGYSEARP